MSELCLNVVRDRVFWAVTDADMMSVMSEIEDYVPKSPTILDSPITLISTYDKLVEKFPSALLALQHYQPQLVEVCLHHIVSEGVSPKSLSDSTEEWDDAQTIFQGTYVRMWYTTPLSPWLQNLPRNMITSFDNL